MSNIKYIDWVPVSYRKLLSISLFVLIAGCQSTPTIVPALKNPGGDVTLSFNRENKILASLEKARVSIDNAEVCAIPNGSSCQINVASGTHVLKVDNPWSYSYGMFSRSYEFSSGKSYQFIISPNNPDLIINFVGTGGIVYNEANKTATSSDNGDFTMKMAD